MHETSEDKNCVGETKLTYYQKNKVKIAEKYQKNKLKKAQYNKEYYQKIKQEKRQNWEYYQYQKDYYRLKKQGMRASDIKRRKEFIQIKNNNNNHIVTF